MLLNERLKKKKKDIVYIALFLMDTGFWIL